MYLNHLRKGAFWGVLLLWAGQALAEAPRVAVTVYNQNLGLVRERRVLELEEGVSVYSFQDVAAQIDPTTVRLRAVDNKGELAVLEQNYEYDLVSSEKLFEKYLEHPVEVFFKDGNDVLSGILLSYRRGNLVLRNPREEKLSVLLGGAVRSVELLGDVADFVTRPTLVWTLLNERSGSREVEVEYLTHGISWHAEYVALADEANENINLSGWVSVVNRSGGEYREAQLKLLAGDVSLTTASKERLMALGYIDGEKAARVEERALFEFHLYEVKRPTTIRKNQVKQISFVPDTQVPVVKEYLYKGQRDAKRVRVYLEFENRREHGLGIPLPTGVVRVFQDDGRGGSEFIGEDRIGHTPKNEKIRIRVGYAFDIVGERKVVSEDRVTKHEVLRTVEIRLRNRKEGAVEIKVSEGIEGDWIIEKENFEHRKEDAHTAEWVVPVGVDEEVVLEYTVRIRR